MDIYSVLSQQLDTLECIYVLPTHGLGNQLRMIASALIMGKSLMKHVRIFWTKELQQYIDHNQNTLDMVFSNEYQSIRENATYTNTHIQPILDQLTHQDKDIQKIMIQQLKSNKFWLLVGGHEFKFKSMPIAKFLELKHRMYRDITVLSSIRDAWTSLAFQGNIKYEWVGLHLRNLNPKMDPDSFAKQEFKWNVKRLQKALNEINETYDYKVNIFLSTNCPKIKYYLCGYPNVYQFLADDNEILRDKKNSLVGQDFYVLGQCSKIYGTYMSSYSDESAIMAGCAKVMLDKTEMKPYHSYGLWSKQRHNRWLVKYFQ